MESAQSHSPAIRKTDARALLSKDWLAVWVGGVIIALVLIGVRPGIARFAWSGAADLPGVVFAADNVLPALQLGVLLLTPAAVGARRLCGIRRDRP